MFYFTLLPTLLSIYESVLVVSYHISHAVECLHLDHLRP